jgi:hypothetical protein
VRTFALTKEQRSQAGRRVHCDLLSRQRVQPLSLLLLVDICTLGRFPLSLFFSPQPCGHLALVLLKGRSPMFVGLVVEDRPTFEGLIRFGRTPWEECAWPIYPRIDAGQCRLSFYVL